MHRNMFARIVKLVIAGVIATACLGTTSAVVINSAVPVAGAPQPTPWP